MEQRVGGFGFIVRALTIWRPSQYNGETVLGVNATELGGTGLGPAELRRVFAEWIEFLGSGQTNIRELQLMSRVPQALIDALKGQSQLERLFVKWGPYRDVNSIGALTNLTTLRLGGATGLESLDPLRALPDLTSLAVIGAHRLDGTGTLRQLTTLTHLTFGNDHPGSDKNVVIEDLSWVPQLRELRSLLLPGARLIDPDLSPLLELPHLEELRLPMRRANKAQVFEFAQHSPAFAKLAREFESYESWRTSPKK